MIFLRLKYKHILKPPLNLLAKRGFLTILLYGGHKIGFLSANNTKLCSVLPAMEVI